MAPYYRHYPHWRPEGQLPPHARSIETKPGSQSGFGIFAARPHPQTTLAPPLVINGEEVDELVGGIDRAVTRLEADLQIG